MLCYFFSASKIAKTISHIQPKFHYFLTDRRTPLGVNLVPNVVCIEIYLLNFPANSL
jgi:hypothetical protein